MYHTIQFATELNVDLETSSRHRLERIRLRAGDRVQAQIRPHVVETDDGPVEAADLYLSDGTTIRGVHYAAFGFVE